MAYLVTICNDPAAIVTSIDQVSAVIDTAEVNCSWGYHKISDTILQGAADTLITQSALVNPAIDVTGVVTASIIFSVGVIACGIIAAVIMNETS